MGQDRLNFVKASCLTCIHLIFYLKDANKIKETNLCDRLGTVLRYPFITPINFCTYFWEVGGFILVIATIFLFMGLTPFHVTPQPKYSISVCLKNDFTVFHLSPFPFSLLGTNYNFCT